jgi:purine-binding chemotaxis protein CheW
MTDQKTNFSERQMVIFKIDNEEFGVDIAEVREIIRMEKITKIPNAPEYIVGVINLRGTIIVVVHLAMKLGLKTKKEDINSRIIVIEFQGTILGMIVDSASEVLRLPTDNIKPAPAVITKKISSNYLEGVGILNERLLILLDLAKVLDSDELQMVQQMQSLVDSKESTKDEKTAKTKSKSK